MAATTVMTERIPQEVLQMNELEFSEFFGELIQYMEKQKWSHLAAPLTEHLQNEIDELNLTHEADLDEENALRESVRDQDRRVKEFKDELEQLLRKL